MNYQLEPHCFGQAVSFFATSAICKRCDSNIKCAKKVMTRLEDINKRLDVTDVMRSTQTFLDKNGVVTDAIKSTGKTRFATSSRSIFEVDIDLSKCSKRSGMIAKSILTRGIDIKADIKRNDNKLHGVKPLYLADLQDHIGRYGKITHNEVTSIIRNKLPDHKQTSISNASSWVIQALVAINVLEKYGDNYVLTD